MSGNVSNYIGHNQWDGLNFANFYNKVVYGYHDKVILFCQNEWEWHAQPELFNNLLSFCKSRKEIRNKTDFSIVTLCITRQ